VWSEHHVRAVARGTGGGAACTSRLDSGMGRPRHPATPHEADAPCLALARELRGVEAGRAECRTFATGRRRRRRRLSFRAPARQRFAALGAGEAQGRGSRGCSWHAANSAAPVARLPPHTSRWPVAASPSMAWTPFGEDAAGAWGSRPALELSSYVAEVKPCRNGARAPAMAGGSSPSTTRSSACLPIGLRRRLAARACRTNADVLIAGERRALVGTVSMDKRDDRSRALTPDGALLRSQPATLIGPRRASSGSPPRSWRDGLQTINYEITWRAWTPAASRRRLSPRRAWRADPISRPALVSRLEAKPAWLPARYG